MALLTITGGEVGMVLKDGVYYFPGDITNSDAITITCPLCIGGNLISTGGAADINSNSDLVVKGKVISGRDLIVATGGLFVSSDITIARNLTVAYDLSCDEDIFAVGAILVGKNLSCKHDIVGQANITSTAGVIRAGGLVTTDNSVVSGTSITADKVVAGTITAGASSIILVREMEGTVSAGIVHFTNG